MEDQRRHQFLEDNRAVQEAGWLPPAAEVPELADLRADHDRLLDAVAGARREAFELRLKRGGELEAQRAGQEAAFLGHAPEPVPTATVTEEEVDQARVRADAARDALQTFAQQAIATIREQEPALVDKLDATVAEAEAKREEALAIIAAAEAMEASTRRLRAWLGRATGRSVLGQYAYEQMEAPDGDGGANGGVTVAELYAAQTPPIGFTEQLDDAPFGTDDPDNLDSDGHPWELVLGQEAHHGN